MKKNSTRLSEEHIKINASYLKEALDSLKLVIKTNNFVVYEAKHYENEQFFNVNLAFLEV
jgi:hypothetical protein